MIFGFMSLGVKRLHDIVHTDVSPCEETKESQLDNAHVLYMFPNVLIPEENRVNDGWVDDGKKGSRDGSQQGDDQTNIRYRYSQDN